MEHGVDKTIGWSIYAKMIGGWLFAVLLALLNHVFFAHMDGKDTSYYSENVITASKNTLATAVQLTLVLVEGLALVQLAWYLIKGKQFTIKKLDSLFSLPSFSTLVELCFSRSLFNMFPLIAFTIISVLMALIPIFVPAALTVQRASPVPKRIMIPSLDLSYNYSQNLAVSGSNRFGSLTSAGPTPLLRRVTEMTMGLTSPLPFSPPIGCTFGCEYSFTYDAIATQCRDLGPNEVSNGNTTTGALAYLSTGYFPYFAYLYNATLLYNIYLDQPRIPFTFTMAYIDSRYYRNSTDPNPWVAGILCTFHNATYSATTQFSGFSQQSTVSAVQVTSEPLTNMYDTPCDPIDYRNTTFLGTPPCYNTRFNSEAIIKAFSEALSGTAGIDAVAGGNYFYNNTYAMASLFSTTLEGNIGPEGFVVTNQTARIGLGAAIQQLLGNVTLSLMSPEIAQSHFVEIDAFAIPFATQYKYSRIQLLVIYVISLVLVGVSVLLGIVAMCRNGYEKQNLFSDFILTARDDSLNKIGEGEGDVLQTVLKYDHHHDSEEKVGAVLKRRQFRLVDES